MLVDISLHFFLRHRVDVHRALGVRFDQIVRTLTGLAFFAVHLGVGETRGVPGSFPYSAVH